MVTQQSISTSVACFVILGTLCTFPSLGASTQVGPCVGCCRRGIYLSFSGALRGETFSPVGLGQRLIAIGFRFFCLLCVSAYTANLAASLTTEASRSSVSTLDDLRGKRVCIYEPLFPYLSVQYPSVEWVQTAWVAEYRTFHAGNCDAIVMMRGKHDDAHSGHLNHLDCEAYQRGELSASEAQCQTKTRDCALQRFRTPWIEPLLEPLPKKKLRFSACMQSCVAGWGQRRDCIRCLLLLP